MSDVWRPFHREPRPPSAAPVLEAAAALQSFARDLQIAVDHLNRQHLKYQPHPNNGRTPPPGDSR